MRVYLDDCATRISWSSTCTRYGPDYATVAPGFVMPFDIAKSELDRILKNLERDIQDEIRTKTRGKRQTNRNEPLRVVWPHQPGASP